MSDIIKVGSFDVTSIKIGSTPVDKVMVGTVKVYPQETPVTSYKWLATYGTAGTVSAECDATSAISENEISKTSGTSNLTSLIIGDCVTSIGNRAFRSYSSLSSVTIPNSVTSIGQEAFYNCGGLTSVTIGSGVTSIGESAFERCSGLTSITIPSGVTSIGDDAFYMCTRLSNVTIPDSVTTIGEYAFASCISLELITIPDSVTTIGRWAFQYCDNLQTVTIGSGITSIGEYAFQSCDKITAVTINATTPPTVGTVTFSRNTYPIYVPCASVDAYKTTGYWTRYADSIKCNQTNMQITYLAASKANVNLNGFTPAATAETFENGLGRVEFASDVTYVGSGFSGKTSVTTIFLPDSVTSIGDYAFKTCSAMTSINIPSGVTSIGNSAFYRCTSLTSITIPSGVTSISESAFDGCTSLSSIIIPSGVTSIGDYAFESCYSLELITIPNNVASIGRGAFIECGGLTEVTIGSGVTSIEQSAFQFCSGLTAITINATTPPTLANANAFNNTNNCPINVPCASVSAYKTALNWSTHASRIQCEGPVDYQTKYFTVVLDESGTITYSASSTANIVQYSTDNGSTWTSLQSRTSTPTISGGKKVFFKATGLTVNTTNGIGRFSATTSFSVEGNPMSLVSGDSFANADTIPNNNQFRRLFYNITGLTNAENLVLPATTLTNGCYYGMFYGCSKLIKGPRKMEIPATMSQSGCTQMFYNCSSMTECLLDVGSLSSTTLGQYCYYNMFRTCKSLTALTSNSSQVMLSSAVALPNQAYYGMFAGCSALTQSVYIGATDIPSSSSAMCQMFSGCSYISEIYCATTGLTQMCNGSYSPMYEWVRGTGSAVGSENCKFHKHVNATWDTSCQGQYYASIPQGWQVFSDITT